MKTRYKVAIGCLCTLVVLVVQLIETENDAGSLYVVRGNDRIYLVYERL